MPLPTLCGVRVGVPPCLCDPLSRYVFLSHSYVFPSHGYVLAALFLTTRRVQDACVDEKQKQSCGLRELDIRTSSLLLGSFLFGIVLVEGLLWV